MVFEIVKKYMNKALLPTLVITLIFFLNFYLFGMNNTIIGPFATLSFLRFRNMKDHYSCMVKTLFIYLIMSVLAYLALINLALCIIINALALFWITYYLIDEYNPNNYFPAGMSLIFFQIFPAGNLQELAVRWLALFASFLIIFLFLILLFRSKKEDPLKLFIKEGLLICNEIIESLEAGHTDVLHEQQHKLCEINKNISTEIYIANRASLRKEVSANRYCAYVALFQIVNHVSDKFVLCDEKPDSDDCSNILYDLQIVKNMLRNYESALDSDIALTDTKKLNFRDIKADIRSFRLRFALRIVISVTPCLVFAFFFAQNSYWLAISVFFMVIPVYENTFRRIAERTKGTVAGILICLVLFSIFKDLPSRIIIMTVANFFIYCANSYAAMVTYITCSALALNDLTASTVPMLMERLLYTAAGALITLIASRFIFPIRSASSISYIKELLDNMRGKLQMFQTLDHMEKNQQLNRLIIKSYLLSSRLDVHGESLKDKGKTSDIKEYQKMHMMYIANWLISGRN